MLVAPDSIVSSRHRPSVPDGHLARGHVRRRPLGVVLAVVCLLAAACSSSGEAVVAGPAATVNGTEISVEQVVDLARELDDGLEAQLGDEAAGDQRVATDLAANVLTELIFVEVAKTEVADRGIDLAEGDRDVALEALYSQMGQDPMTGMADPEQGRLAFEDTSEMLQELLVEFELVRQALTDTVDPASIGDDEISEVYEDQREGRFERRCLDGAFFSPDPLDAMARATDVRDALDEGVSVDDAIDSDPTDPAAPQAMDFGCITRAELGDPELIDEVFDAEIGTAIGPVDTGGGLLVAVVYDEEVDELDDVADQLRQELSQGEPGVADAEFFELVTGLVAEADVWVDPRFGTWQATDAFGEPLADDADPAEAAMWRVVPPEGPQDPPPDSPEMELEGFDMGDFDPGEFEFDPGDLDLGDLDLGDLDLGDLNLDDLQFEELPEGP